MIKSTSKISHRFVEVYRLLNSNEGVPLYSPLPLLPFSQKLKHWFAFMHVRYLARIFNQNANNFHIQYRTVARTNLSTSENFYLIRL